MAATTFIGHFLGPDTHTNRPSATGLPNGTLYVCTTHSKIERVVSGAWADYATLGGGGAVATDTIWDAKGDLAAGTGADTASKLTVGSDGQILQADSTQTTGLKWAAASSGALTLLSTTTLSSPGTFDVSSISGSYNDLILVLIARGTDAGTTDSSNVRFNNDSGANYYNQFLYANGNTGGSAAFLGGGTTGRTGNMPAAGGTANLFSNTQIVVPGYASTSWLKTALTESFAPGTTATPTYMYVNGTLWNSTAAITRIQILGGNTANLATGSQLGIYGRT